MPMRHRLAFPWLGGIVVVTSALLAAACSDDSESNFVLATSSTTTTLVQDPTATATDDDPADSTDTSATTATTTVAATQVDVENSTPSTTAPQSNQGTTLTDSARVSTLGLGPVYMGDTLEQVADKIGVQLDPEEFGNDSCRYYLAPGGPPGVSFVVAFGRIARVDIDDPSTITTRSGAGIGSTKAEIIALFGAKIVVGPHPFSDGEYLTFVPVDEKDANLRIIFETNSDGVVTAYRTGQLPEVDYIEGCA